MGFLWYNSHPAAIFMGDTGSLALGAALAGMAVATGRRCCSLLIGGMFVVEALSVIIQVFSFRLFHKRVFLMAPIHHHFELKGWSETKIIVRFWIVAAILRRAGFTLYYLSFNQGITGQMSGRADGSQRSDALRGPRRRPAGAVSPAYWCWGPAARVSRPPWRWRRWGA